ncbi:phage tail assembly protein [Photobacterium minamisatsumaniensis]|uniref:phage tail assembly protein n=1 Tax=Photobacterium minamisatsumaniensis TaxID=2910233 RepID=UPI003D0F0D1A
MKKTIKLPFYNRNGNHEIDIKPISLGEFRKLPYVNFGVDKELIPSELFQQLKAMILACTDISTEEFEELSAPDFTQLHEDIRAFILKPSDEIQEKPLSGSDFEFELLFPFANDLNESISRIKFVVPKVKHSEALAEITEDTARENFMFSVVCNLDKPDMEAMALNDYLAIKPQVGAFFQLSGDYFLPTT